MLRRPQRTEAAQRLEARTVRTFEAPLRAGVSSNNCPARSLRKPLRLKREHGAYRGLVRPRHDERTSQRHGACARHWWRAFPVAAARAFESPSMSIKCPIP